MVMTPIKYSHAGADDFDLSIVLCGEAGQGIQTVEQILSEIVRKAGYHVLSTKEYMSRVRGGSNSTQIRISTRPVGACVDRMDIVLPLNQQALEHVASRISDQTRVIGDKAVLATQHPVHDISFTDIAAEAGSKLYANTVAIGLICGLVGMDRSLLDDALAKRFGNKGEQVVQDNVKAGARGYDKGVEIADHMGELKLPAMPEPMKDHILLNGARAVALGALTGGCNFIGSYPMSPGTGVLTALAGYSHDFDIVVEQAEDEIAAVNMAMGAWYAGARALVTTSGGGFALMCEGVSCAGMIESPLVIHVAQRPGPATGLPTRTEQSDLNLVLFAGHGEFPRIILAPGTLAQAFQYTQMAFDLADRFQVPVFILTDQYLMDSYYTTPRFSVPDNPPGAHIFETEHHYQRFQITENGISPRGIPGFGSGIVCVDSDEHTQEGYITEDMSVRNAMVEKRQARLKIIAAQAIEPTLIGDGPYRILVACWGSNYHVVTEAVEFLGRGDIAVLHFVQLYPLPATTLKHLTAAQTTIMVENNAGGQLAVLITKTTGHHFDQTILKYSGLPFTVEEVATALQQAIDAKE
jgi:2-oxoglutarate ferredoxin oxidoreductase subunit alpha